MKGKKGGPAKKGTKRKRRWGLWLKTVFLLAFATVLTVLGGLWLTWESGRRLGLFDTRPKMGAQSQPVSHPPPAREELRDEERRILEEVIEGEDRG